jgi:hypothetical protein
MAAQEAAEVSPMSAGTELPLGRDRGTWMAIMVTEEAAEAAQRAVDAGASLGREEESLATPGATRGGG